MTIAPNGVDIADYDPMGIGAMVFAVVDQAGVPAANVEFGEVVDAATVGLKPAAIIDYPADAANGVTDNGAVLTGSWRCLGFIHLTNTTINQSATLFMRVA